MSQQIFLHLCTLVILSKSWLGETAKSSRYSISHAAFDPRLANNSVEQHYCIWTNMMQLRTFDFLENEVKEIIMITTNNQPFSIVAWCALHQRNACLSWTTFRHTTPVQACNAVRDRAMKTTLSLKTCTHFMLVRQSFFASALTGSFFLHSLFAWWFSLPHNDVQNAQGGEGGYWAIFMQISKL